MNNVKHADTVYQEYDKLVKERMWIMIQIFQRWLLIGYM